MGIRFKWTRAILLGCLVISTFAADDATSSPTRQRLHDDSASAGRREQNDSCRPQQISTSDIRTLSEQGYVVIPNFLSQSLVDELRQDVATLRSSSAFKQAKIGQDSTNVLNVDIRVSETCFLGRSRPELTSIRAAGGADSVRDRPGGLYDILDDLFDSLSELSWSNSRVRLDESLSELLYAYYPRGGFYRRHRDAVPGSASVLREYSLLLYLNEEGWDVKVDAGQLRLHRDGGGDECPPGVEPNFIDVDPLGGTLVLFKSEVVPHEVLDTNAERFALVGWYNRAVTAADIGHLSDAGGSAYPQSVTSGDLGLLFESLLIQANQHTGASHMKETGVQSINKAEKMRYEILQIVMNTYENPDMSDERLNAVNEIERQMNQEGSRFRNHLDAAVDDPTSTHTAKSLFNIFLKMAKRGLHMQQRGNEL